METRINQEELAENLYSPFPKSIDGNHFDDPRVLYVEETEKYKFTGEDGIDYEWDPLTRGWFPMWKEELLESQQSAYQSPLEQNNNKNDEKQNNFPKRKRQIYTKPEEAKKDVKEKEKVPHKVTSVYVCGLPADTVKEEVEEYFKKCGIIMEDVKNGESKVKLYHDAESGFFKGDALVTYLREESVDLAINLLDDTFFRPNEKATIRVQKAEFKEKSSNGEQEAKGKKTKYEKQKIKQKIQKLEKKLDWNEDNEGGAQDKYKKITILQNMFTPKEIEDDPTLLIDLKEDIRKECEKLGEVTNVVVYDKSPEGAVSVRFRDPLSAELCVKLMNGRYFAQKRIEAEICTGRIRFLKSTSKVEHEGEEEEEKKRLEKYAEYLEKQSSE